MTENIKEIRVIQIPELTKNFNTSKTATLNSVATVFSVDDFLTVQKVSLLSIDDYFNLHKNYKTI